MRGYCVSCDKTTPCGCDAWLGTDEPQDTFRCGVCRTWKPRTAKAAVFGGVGVCKPCARKEY